MPAQNIGFLIIGAARRSTTWLQEPMQAYVAVSMPDPELHCFSRDFDHGHR